jgi:hypothetical protein
MQQQSQMQQNGAEMPPASEPMPSDMGMPMEEQAMAPEGEIIPEMEKDIPTLDSIYQSAPPEIQEQIDMMMEQGMSEQDIIQQLLSLMG